MGCPYSFGDLWANHAKKSDFASRAELYPYLGWGGDKSMMTSDDWANTCAVRMSICLTRCGMSLESPPIGARVQQSCPDRRLRGKAIVLGFDRLAKILKKRWGAPTVLPNLQQSDLNNMKGVIAFFGLPGGYPGHIDLIRDSAMPWSLLIFSGDSTSYESGTGSYFGSRESWFWPSKG